MGCWEIPSFGRAELATSGWFCRCWSGCESEFSVSAGICCWEENIWTKSAGICAIIGPVCLASSKRCWDRANSRCINMHCTKVKIQNKSNFPPVLFSFKANQNIRKKGDILLAVLFILLWQPSLVGWAGCAAGTPWKAPHGLEEQFTHSTPSVPRLHPSGLHIPVL